MCHNYMAAASGNNNIRVWSLSGEKKYRKIFSTFDYIVDARL